MMKFGFNAITLTAICDYLTFFLDLVSGKRTKAHLHANQDIIKILNTHLSTSSSIRLLDLANGQLQPQIKIFESKGFNVTGIDLINQKDGSINDFLYKIARFLFSCHQFKIKAAPKQLVCGDVSILPFQDDSFDAIYSLAAFEHFLDVGTVLSECNRVLKKGGVIIAYIHLFTSLSGGHNVGRRLMGLNHLPGGVEPWDHLRARIIPFTVPLNELRISDYLNEFRKRFSILRHQCMGREGEKLLTDEIRKALPQYSHEELTCSNYLIIARKDN